MILPEHQAPQSSAALAQRSSVAVTLKWVENVKDISEKSKKGTFSTPKSLQVLSQTTTQN